MRKLFALLHFLSLTLAGCAVGPSDPQANSTLIAREPTPAEQTRQINWVVQDQSFTLPTQAARLEFPAVAGVGARFSLQTQQGQLRFSLNAQGDLPDLQQWPGRTIPVHGLWNEQPWQGSMKVVQVKQTILQATLIGTMGTTPVSGRFQTQVETIAYP